MGVGGRRSEESPWMTDTIRRPFPYREDRGTIIEHWLYRDRTRRQEPTPEQRTSNEVRPWVWDRGYIHGLLLLL